MKYIKIKTPETDDDSNRGDYIRRNGLQGKVLLVIDKGRGDEPWYSFQVPITDLDTDFSWSEDEFEESTEEAFNECWKGLLENPFGLFKSQVETQEQKKAQRNKELKEEQQKKTDEVKAELGEFAEAFTSGDWGCQGDSVKSILKVINSKFDKIASRLEEGAIL